MYVYIYIYIYISATGACPRWSAKLHLRVSGQLVNWSNWSKWVKWVPWVLPWVDLIDLLGASRDFLAAPCFFPLLLAALFFS